MTGSRRNPAGERPASVLKAATNDAPRRALKLFQHDEKAIGAFMPAPPCDRDGKRARRSRFDPRRSVGASRCRE
ncbi:hypothetical protein ASE69_06350 [Sphingomonas sp. Leaf208]|nr:hypothetical protein ASE69_06350 [Sphingomonas sp. Leaf208]